MAIFFNPKFSSGAVCQKKYVWILLKGDLHQSVTMGLDMPTLRHDLSFESGKVEIRIKKNKVLVYSNKEEYLRQKTNIACL